MSAIRFHANNERVRLDECRAEIARTKAELATVTADRDRLQSRLLDTQASCTIWMENSKKNSKELNESYEAMCDIAAMLGCSEDWGSILSAIPAPTEPKPEAPKCPACDDGLIWHEKEPGFQQWSTKCGVCGGTGRAQ